MKIAILGTGKVAHALGAGWKKVGHDVMLGSRNASATDPDFDVFALQDALAAGDLIVNAITGAAALPAITSSLAEHLQAALPAVHVVKSLNTSAVEVQADPSVVGPATVFVSGDDEAAKIEVKGLLSDLGWKEEEIIDLGSIQTARGPENYIVLFFATIGVLKSPFFNIHIAH
jgi:predicted dinucleotide-binding enzyme